ncbi:MAG: SRPBCC domain-containing protein [Pseudomonadota bacterium]
MDAIFKALSDETRRNLLDMLREKDGQTLSELEAELARRSGEAQAMTRFGVMKHLKLLEEASLVVTRRSGRFKYHYLNAVPLQEVIDRWIEPLTQKPLARMALDLKAELEGRRPMSETEKPDFVLETYIKTSIDKLWAALTEADHSEKYHFAKARINTDMTKGSRFDKITPDGSVMLGGKILDLDPPRRLDLTFEPGWCSPEEKNHSRVSYELEAMGDICKLTILHYAIPEGQDGVKDGWARVVASLKSYLETGEGLDIAPAGS